MQGRDTRTGWSIAAIAVTAALALGACSGEQPPRDEQPQTPDLPLATDGGALADAGGGAPDLPTSGLPDLVLTSVSWQPTSPQADDAVAFSATIKNAGAGPTPAGTIIGVRFSIDGAVVAWSDQQKSALAQGASVTVTASGGPAGGAAWKAAEGTHGVEAWVDDVDRISEADEDNNRLQASLTVKAAGGGQGLPAALIPFAQPALATLQASSKLVVAHWHQFPVSRSQGGATGDLYSGYLGAPNSGMSIRVRPLGRPARSGSDWKLADARVDIRRAQQIGVDAFFVNCGKDLNNGWAWPQYTLMLEAAEQLKTGFKVAPNIDCVNGAGGDGAWMAKVILDRLKTAGKLASPGQLRVKGKFAVGSFHASNCSVKYWTDLRSTLKQAGLDPHVMCVFLGGAYRADYDPVCDSWSDWGRKDPFTAPASDYSKRYAAVLGKEPIVAAISHGDVRYKNGDYIAYESRGSETLRINWDEAINTGADWAQLVTWNDLGEHAVFYPNTGQQFAFYDLAAYFIAWFKTGQPPAINKDALYYFHRVAKGPPWPKLRAGTWSNLVEVVAFLTAPATVEIITAAGTTSKALGAGVQVLTAPMPSSGKPRFRVVRGGAAVVDVTSAFTVGPMPPQNDVVYRGGGSLRTIYGLTTPAAKTCQTASADVCLMTPGEPVWLAQ
jgi:hypothetical protein